MKTSNAARVSALLAIVGVLVPGSLAQPGGGGPGGSSGGSGGGGPPSTDDDGSKAECENDGSSAHYEEFFAGSGSTMVRWGGSNTGCPNHVNWELNPNPAKENPSNESIPAYPMMFENDGTTDLSSTANAIGIMRNGVTMYSAWALNTVVEYEDTAFYLEADTFDLCGGHATTEGTYHYHGTAGCIQEQAQLDAGTSEDEHSALLGWAYDGFPIYGQLGPDGVEMKGCGLDGADETHCLDVCSGYEALIPEVDDFTYRYYTSCGFDESFFPFTTNCFRGCCPDGIECSPKVEACGDNPVDGYTADYVPVITNDLSVQYDALLITGDDTDFIDSDYSVNCSLYMGEGSSTFSSDVTSPTTTPAPMAIVTDGTAAPAADSSASDSSASVIDGGVTPAPMSGRRDPEVVVETPSPSVARERGGGGQDRPTISPAFSQAPMTAPTRPPMSGVPDAPGGSPTPPPTSEDASTRPPTPGGGPGSDVTEPTPMPSSSTSTSTTPAMSPSTTPSPASTGVTDAPSSTGDGVAPTPAEAPTSAGDATGAPSSATGTADGDDETSAAAHFVPALALAAGSWAVAAAAALHIL